MITDSSHAITQTVLRASVWWCLVWRVCARVLVRACGRAYSKTCMTTQLTSMMKVIKKAANWRDHTPRSRVMDLSSTQRATDDSRHALSYPSPHPPSLSLTFLHNPLPPPPPPEPPTPSRQYSNRPSCSPFPSHRCIRCPVRVHIRQRLHLRAPGGVIARPWLGVLLHVHPRAHATATSAARVGPAMRSSAGNLSPDTGQTGQSAGSADPGSPARVGAG